MAKHKQHEGSEPGHTDIHIRPDHIIFVEPIGYMTGTTVHQLLADLQQAITTVQQQGYPVRILTHIGRITKHTSESRTALKEAAKLPFERGAAYGGNAALGLLMQYLQRSIDSNRAQYFRTEAEALAYLNNGTSPSRQGFGGATLRFLIIAGLLLGLFSASTYLSWNTTREHIAAGSAALFTQQTQATHSELQKRMDIYVEALYGFRGLFNASHSVERNEFDAYYRTLDLTADFPGLNALSYVQHVPGSQLAAFTASVRHDTSMTTQGYPTFQVYPASTKDSYDVVTYVEPGGTASGYDLSSDPARKTTLDTARDSGLPTASASVTFASTPPADGFLVTLAVYSGQTPTTVAARQSQLQGYVNAVFQYSSLFKAALSGLDAPSIAVEIHDDQGHAIYLSGKSPEPYQIAHDKLTVGGRNFDVYFKAPETYGLTATTETLPTTILSSGIVSIVLLVIVLVTLLRSRRQAIKLADAMTTDLEHERNIAIENEHKLALSEAALAREKASVEQKVVERTKELNEAHAQLEASLKSLPFGFAIINRDHQIIFSNQALGTIVGPGKVPPDSGHEAHLSFEKLTKTLHGSLDIVSLLGQAAAGHQPIEIDRMLGAKYLHTLLIPITANHGELIGWVVVIEDVTEEKALARSKDEFFSIASHELRTPLTVIRGNASMLLELYEQQLKDPTLQRMVTDIRDATVRLINIVNDFLDMSRLEQGKAITRPTAVNLASLINEVVQEHEPAARQQGIYLKVATIQQDSTIMTDAARVKEILSNLITNALHVTHSGGITIQLDRDAQTAKIAVIDTGSGIPVETQHLLFHKFQQAGQSIYTRESSQSTGLGLYVSRLLAELLGGTLYLASSEPKKGSSFILELPTKPPKQPSLSTPEDGTLPTAAH